MHLQIALSYWNQRRYDDSIEWANRALALDPHHLLAREHLAGAYWKKGDFDRHMAEALRHAEEYGTPAAMLEDVRRVYAAGGRAAVLKDALVRLAAAGDNGPAVQLAILHGEAGDLDAAFHHLDRALDARDPAWSTWQWRPSGTRCAPTPVSPPAWNAWAFPWRCAPRSDNGGRRGTTFFCSSGVPPANFRPAAWGGFSLRDETPAGTRQSSQRELSGRIADERPTGSARGP